MNPNDLPQVEMIACEGCGSYHKKEECEVVVIRIIKGKDCQIPLVRKNSIQPAPAVFIPPQQSSPAVPTAVATDSAAPAIPVEPKKNIIPSKLRYIGAMPNQMGGLMMDPTHPQFETKGDKERRVA